MIVSVGSIHKEGPRDWSQLINAKTFKSMDNILHKLPNNNEVNNFLMKNELHASFPKCTCLDQFQPFTPDFMGMDRNKYTLESVPKGPYSRPKGARTLMHFDTSYRLQELPS